MIPRLSSNRLSHQDRHFLILDELDTYLRVWSAVVADVVVVRKVPGFISRKPEICDRGGWAGF